MGRPRKVTSQPSRGQSKKKGVKKTPQPVIKKYKPNISFNETFFRALIEHNSNAITLLDESGKVIYDSPAARGMLGYSPTEWLGKSVFQLVHPDDLPKIQTLFENLLKKKGSQSQAIFRICHKDNHWIWIDATATNLLHKPNVKAIVVNYRDITQIKQSEDALTSNEKNFRMLIENISDWFAKVDSQGMVTYVSGPVTRSLGYSIEEFIGTNIFSLIHPEDIPHTQSLFAQLLQDPTQTVSAQYRIKNKDGSWKWVESVGKNLLNDSNIRAIIGNFRDITERKKAEEALRKSEETFSVIFKKATFAAALASLTDGTYLEVNDEFERIFGFSRAEAIGKTSLELGMYPDPEVRKRSAEQFMAQGFLRNFEIQLISKDGQIRTVLTNTDLVEISGQKYILTTANDISERKQAEKKLQLQNERLKVLREIDMAILAADSVEHIVEAALIHIRELVDCQRASLALIDWETDEGVIFNVSANNESVLPKGTRVPRVLFDEMNQMLLKNEIFKIDDLTALPSPPTLFQTGIKEGLRSLCVLPLFSQNKLMGAFSMSSETIGFFNEEKINLAREVANQVAIAITQNGLINELQELNAKLEQRVKERTTELNQANLKLEHASRAKDEFLANMSHELRTPLNSILGLSESMLEQYQETLNENQQKSLQIIEASGKHLLDLINDILDLSKIEAGKFDYYPQLIHADDLCKSSIIFVKNQATKKNIALAYEIEEGISSFSADPRRLKQVLVNLLTNAVKFTQNDGHVTLKVNADEEKEVIQFSVIDSGIGIAPEDLRRLFTPFVQVESSLNRHFEGTGLGLALVQKLTDLHGGSVEVESEVGKGSRFTIKLPYQQNMLGQEKEAEKIASQPINIEFQYQPKATGSHQKILLVEDNQTNILTIGEYLENYGYEIIVANDGLQAIEKANEFLPAVILMDVQMPVMDGLEATRRLRSDVRFATTPMIALTALAMPGDRERCLEAGATEYMSKPVSLKELKKVIENFLK
jgi:PAS domain S-box-containing protein